MHISQLTDHMYMCRCSQETAELLIGIAAQSTFEPLSFEVEPTKTVMELKKLWMATEPRCPDDEDVCIIKDGEELKMGQKGKPEKDKLSGYGIVAGQTYKLLLIWKEAEKAKKTAEDNAKKAAVEAEKAAKKAAEDAEKAAAEAEKKAAEEAEKAAKAKEAPEAAATEAAAPEAAAAAPEAAGVVIPGLD